MMEPLMALQWFGFSIADLLRGVVTYGYWALFIAILGSIIFGWIGYPSGGFLQTVHNAVRAVADPILMPIRSRIPPLRLGGFGLDLSPIIALIGLLIARGLLYTIIDIVIRPVTG